MKRTIGICFFILYLLTICLLLSQKIDWETQNQVILRPITVTEKSGNYFVISDDCVFAQYLSNTIFKLEAGTGWQDGLRVSPLDVNEYNIDPAQRHVEINTSQDMQVIRHAVHFPRAGEKAREIQQGTRADRYLLLYPYGKRPYTGHLTGITVLGDGDNACLLSVADGGDPFTEDQAQERLQGMESDFWQIYSLRDVEVFLKTLPKLAGVAGVLWAMIILGIHCCILIGKVEYRRILWGNVGLEALLMLTLVLVLKSITLPGSLLPSDSILDLRYYVQELETIFDTLTQFSQQEQPLIALRQNAERLATIILYIAAATPLLWCFGWAVKKKRKTYGNCHNRNSIRKNLREENE